MNNIISWFAKNHVAANLLMFFLILAGILSIMTIKVEVFPEFSLDSVSISAVYPGASPAEVEEGVIRRIEENISGVSGIKRIDSTALEGVASVTVEAIKDWDIQKLVDDIKAEVDRITTFPEEMEQPVVSEISRQTKVLDIAIYGDAPESTLKHLAETIKDDLTTLPGITLADLFAVREGEIHIEIPEKTLRQYDLTLGMVSEIVRKSSLDLPAGSVKTSDGEVLIRTKGRRYFATEYADIAVVTKSDGTKLTLGRIADIKEDFEDFDLITRFMGKPAVMIFIYRVANQNALDVVKTARQYLDNISRDLPEGISIGYSNDRSEILKSRMDLLLKNMAIGLLLVSIMLGLFLNIRLAFWVTLGIPVSFLMGMWLLPYFDVSINMISLFAFIMVLGIVVDDAIVVGENIFRKQEQGFGPIKGSIEGCIQVGRPVVFSVLTTIAAFYPLLLSTGSMGKMMRNIPVVVILVLIGSLVESLFILPSHLAGAKPTKPKRSKEPKGMPKLLARLTTGPYFRSVSFCLKWRYATFATGIVFLLLSIGIIKGGWLKFTFMPKVESDNLVCSVTLPSGTPFENTIQIAKFLEETGREILDETDSKRPDGAPSLFKHSLTLIGKHMRSHGPMAAGPSTGSNLAQVNIQLLEGEHRDVSAMDLVAMWRKKVGEIEGAESINFQSELFSVGSPVEIHLSLNDHNKLLAAAELLKTELISYPGVFDVMDSFIAGKPEFQLKLKPAARNLGLTLSDLALQVRHAFYGAEALRIQRGQDEVKVFVRYPESERKSVDNIENMRIRLSDGTEIPFRHVAEVTISRGYASIERAQRRRVIKVYADVDETVANANEVRMFLADNFLPKLNEDFPGLRYTIEGAGKEQAESMSDIFKGFIIALFAIYALLAIPFRSFSQPLIVMSAIPFGIVGAFAGHLIMGYNLSILSMFGILGLTGVVVNDSLVLVDAANRIRSQGNNDAHDSIVKAGMLRFRAIILTSLTTFAGLSPMIIERSVQAKFLIPMAISLGFGVLFATGITLVLVPCSYLILEDIGNILNSVKSIIFGKQEQEST
ncbi:MAG: efflux RND transporter permease subunit [Desulfobacterales bacterium]|nr:efflux RND transporter permease subunit [Desulfobacterales bacterium]